MARGFGCTSPGTLADRVPPAGIVVPPRGDFVTASRDGLLDPRGPDARSRDAAAIPGVSLRSRPKGRVAHRGAALEHRTAPA